MADNWEDWENEDFIIPDLVITNQEQLKRLEERKLVEEADLENARDLFMKEEDLSIRELRIQETNNLYKNNAIDIKPEKKISNQKINEQKLKEQSKILKEQKAKKEKAKDLYGESQYNDEYSEYEDKFY